MSSPIHSPSTVSSISLQALDNHQHQHHHRSSLSSFASSTAAGGGNDDLFYPSTLTAPFRVQNFASLKDSTPAAVTETDLEAQQRHHLQQFFYFQSLALQRQKAQQQQQQQQQVAVTDKNNDSALGLGLVDDAAADADAEEIALKGFVFPAQTAAVSAEELGDFLTGLDNNNNENENENDESLIGAGAGGVDFLTVPTDLTGGSSISLGSSTGGSTAPSLSLSPSPSSQDSSFSTSAESPEGVDFFEDSTTFNNTSIGAGAGAGVGQLDAETIAEIERVFAFDIGSTTTSCSGPFKQFPYHAVPMTMDNNNNVVNTQAIIGLPTASSAAGMAAGSALPPPQQQQHQTMYLTTNGLQHQGESVPSSAAAALISAMALSATQNHRIASAYDGTMLMMPTATAMNMPEPHPHVYQGGRAPSSSLSLWHHQQQQQATRQAPYNNAHATSARRAVSNAIRKSTDLGALSSASQQAIAGAVDTSAFMASMGATTATTTTTPFIVDRSSIRAAARQSFSGMSSSSSSSTDAAAAVVGPFATKNDATTQSSGFYSSSANAATADKTTTASTSASLPTPPHTQVTPSHAASPAASHDSSATTSSSSVRNPNGGGRGYVPGETPEDPKKKHKCDVCGRGFARLFNLKSHSLTHDPARPKPYDCPHDGCSRSFSRLHDLERHQQGIHSEGPLMVAKEHGISPALARAQERIAKRVRRGEIQLSFQQQ